MRKFTIVIIGIVIIKCFGLFYVQSLRIEHPILTSFTLNVDDALGYGSYISNTTEPIEVKQIELDGILYAPDLSTHMWMFEENGVQQIKPFVEDTFYSLFDFQFTFEQAKQVDEHTVAYIHFSDGSKQKVDIVVHKMRNQKNEIQTVRSSTSSDGTGEMEMVIKKGYTLNRVETYGVESYQLFSDGIRIQLPFTFNETSKLKFVYTSEIALTPNDKLFADLYLKTEQGEIFINTISNYKSSIPSKKWIKETLRAKGVENN